MEYVAFLAVIVLVVAVIMITGIAEEKKVKQAIRDRMKKQYGKYSEKKYADGRMESIVSAVRYDEKGGDFFAIDDITWNDLEMDRLFRAIDFTRSAAGEEALYRWLRMPLFDEEKLLLREKHFEFFEKSERDRLDYLLFMGDVGRTGKYSIYDYLDYLDVLPEKSCLFTKLLDVLLILCLILGLAVHAGFFVPFVGILLYNCFTYTKEKKEIEPYLTTFSYFIRLLDSVKKIDGMSREFRQEFAGEIEKIKKEKGEFSSFKRLSFLAMDDGISTAPMEIGRLILSYLNLIFHLDLMKLYSMLHVVKEKKHFLIAMLRGMGEIEACISVVYARAAFDEYTVPCFVEKTEKEGVCYEAEDLFHPLIEHPVKNSLRQTRGMLLTGSNASGKSTFLKAVAVNALLAQTIHTVCAKAYKSNFFRIYSSMALRDNLLQGESYFIVEIKSIKRIFDGVEEKGAPVLCTIDEVLRGTNTAERIGASTELLKTLAKKGALCFAATHDLELTTLLEGEMDNYHFAEMVEGTDIAFPYLLTKGGAKGRNAIKLLKAFGFDEELVEKAEKLAGGF